MAPVDSNLSGGGGCLQPAWRSHKRSLLSSRIESAGGQPLDASWPRLQANDATRKGDPDSRQAARSLVVGYARFAPIRVHSRCLNVSWGGTGSSLSLGGSLELTVCCRRAHETRFTSRRRCGVSSLPRTVPASGPGAFPGCRERSGRRAGRSRCGTGRNPSRRRLRQRTSGNGRWWLGRSAFGGCRGVGRRARLGGRWVGRQMDRVPHPHPPFGHPLP